MFCLLADTPGSTKKISARRLTRENEIGGSLENRGEIQCSWCYNDRLWGIYALRAQPFLNTVLCQRILVQIVQG